MKTVKCENGVELTWDNTLVVGDLITSYNKGFHKLIKIEPRKRDTPVFSYKLMYNEDGTPVKPSKKVLSCDASYCRRAGPVIISKIQESDATTIRLRDIFLKHYS